MKNIIFALLAGASGQFALNAATCASFGGGSLGDSGPIVKAVWSAPNFSCTVGDKTLSNFNNTSAPDATNLRVFVQGANYIVTFNGNFTAPFSVGYDITVDPSSGNFISAVGLDENAPVNTTAQVVKTVKTTGGANLGTLTVLPSAKPLPLFLHQTALRITDAFSGAGAVSFSNAFVQGLSACPFTQGYWKNHPGAWPVNSLVIGGHTYTKAELLNIFGTPPRGNASIILIHQLIAAMLNVANGSSNVIQPVIDAANAALQQYGLNVRAGTTAGNLMTGLADQLDQYNNNNTNCSGPRD